MLYFWWGCRRILKLITLGIEMFFVLLWQMLLLFQYCDGNFSSIAIACLVSFQEQVQTQCFSHIALLDRKKLESQSYPFSLMSSWWKWTTWVAGWGPLHRCGFWSCWRGEEASSASMPSLLRVIVVFVLEKKEGIVVRKILCWSVAPKSYCMLSLVQVYQLCVDEGNGMPWKRHGIPLPSSTHSWYTSLSSATPMQSTYGITLSNIKFLYRIANSNTLRLKSFSIPGWTDGIHSLPQTKKAKSKLC